MRSSPGGMSRHRSIGRLLKVYWNYVVARRSSCSYPPYRVWVEPTSKCNLKCPMCPNKSLDKSQLGIMDPGLFGKIIDQIAPYVHDMNIHHRGESLLHPDLASMIAYATERGIMVKLHTNATLLDDEKSYQLVQSGLNLISFSFDGLDAETYERCRKGASFHDTVGNIRNFLKIKKKLDSSKPFAILEMMDLSGVDKRYTLRGKKEFVSRFDHLPLDRFVVKKPHNFGGNVRLTPADDPSLRPLTPCTILWHSLVVLWNGEVVPCPQDFFGQMVLGSVREEKLVDIFNTPELIELRKNMLRRQVDPCGPCARCDFIRRPTTLGIPVQSLKYLGK
jgi:radical SAM protein with 4Fe4S-binding SPASM domain